MSKNIGLLVEMEGPFKLLNPILLISAAAPSSILVAWNAEIPQKPVLAVDEDSRTDVCGP